MQQTLILLGVIICNSSQKLIQTALSRTARSSVYNVHCEYICEFARKSHDNVLLMLQCPTVF